MEYNAETFLNAMWNHYEHNDFPASYYARKIRLWCEGHIDDAMIGLDEYVESDE